MFLAKVKVLQTYLRLSDCRIITLLYTCDKSMQYYFKMVTTNTSTIDFIAFVVLEFILCLIFIGLHGGYIDILRIKIRLKDIKYLVNTSLTDIQI